MGAFPNFPEQEDQPPQQPPEPPSPEPLDLPRTRSPSPEASDQQAESEQDDARPFYALPPGALACHDYRAIVQYNFTRRLTLQECLAEMTRTLGDGVVSYRTTAFWYKVFRNEHMHLPLVLKESKTPRERSSSLSPPGWTPRRRIAGQQPSTSSESALEQQQRELDQEQQQQEQLQEQLLQQRQREQQHRQQLVRRELRMLQEQQQGGQSSTMEREIKQEPQEVVERVVVKIEPSSQNGQPRQDEFADWDQGLKPAVYHLLTLNDRIDYVLKNHPFITLQEAARTVGIDVCKLAQIAEEQLHMRKTDGVWLTYDPACEAKKKKRLLDLPVLNFVPEEKIEIGEEFKAIIPPQIQSPTKSRNIFTGEPQEASTCGPILTNILKREFPEATAGVSSTSGFNNGNSSIESSNNNNGNENNQNRNLENSINASLDDNPQPSTSSSSNTSNRTSKPNELSFKGAISDQEPNEKDPLSESTDSARSFFRRTLRRTANTIHKSQTPRKRNADSHACEYCSRFFKYKYHATRHMIYHCPERDSAEKKRIKCEQCEQTFTSNNCKQQHVFFVHQKIRTAVTCDRCKRIFDDEEKLEKHRRRNTCLGGYLKDAVCDKCHRRYRDLNSLRRHREKECDKERPYGCAHCDYRTHQKANIIRHFERKHSEVEMKSTCPRCSRVYKNECSLNRHLQYECGKEPAFACDLCKYKTKRKFCLMNHMRSQHSKKRRV